jgi:thiol-disulfide isomerase/thioredoxin
MSAYDLLPEKLIKNGKLISTEKLLENKTKIAFLYAANYCPYCRDFEPILEKFYEKTKNMYLGDCGYEIIFISRDRSLEDFNEHSSNMPWSIVPYDKTKKLFEFYNPKTIPKIIVVDIDTNEIVNKEARSIIPNINLNNEKSVTDVLESWCGCKK